MSDNFKIDIAWEGDLRKAMEIAFSRYSNVKAYKIDPKKGLMFFWFYEEPKYGETGNRSGSIALPFKMDAAGAADFATRWLAEQDYGREPDHDGSNAKGWRIYNDEWSRVDGYAYSICAIKPCWMEYGK